MSAELSPDIRQQYPDIMNIQGKERKTTKGHIMTTLYKLPPADRLMLAATQLQMAAESAMEWMRANQEEIPILTDSDILAAAESWTISDLDDDRFHGDYEGLKETLYEWVEGQLS